MNIQTVEKMVGRIKRLPRLPDTAVRLVHMLGDPRSTIEDIVDTIRYDQAITADVLRLCNSAYFGLSRQVNSIDDAVRLLGTAKVLQLVMSTHVHSILSRPQEGYGLLSGALWEHSIGVALGCRNFARRLGLRELGMSFTVGLLHDIGKTVLNEFVAAEYAEIVRRVTEERISFLEAEQQTLGFTHPQVGARLAESWSLPEVIVRCLRYHHDPQELATPDLLLDSVYLADLTALLMGIGCGAVDGLAYRGDPAVLERRGLNQRDLESVGAEIVVEVKAVRQLFGTKA